MDGEETWRDVIGYEGLYEVSDRGRVRSRHKGERILSQFLEPNGYASVMLHCRGRKRKRCYVHRLVACAFMKDRQAIVHHRDSVRTNNCLNNLEWTTVAGNNSYTWANGGRAKAKW